MNVQSPTVPGLIVAFKFCQLERLKTWVIIGGPFMPPQPDRPKEISLVNLNTALGKSRYHFVVVANSYYTIIY